MGTQIAVAASILALIVASVGLFIVVRLVRGLTRLAESFMASMATANQPGCYACGVRERTELTVCCRRWACPSHRIGTGDLSDGYCCLEHPFGKDGER